jgi:hypothetical protein
VNLDDELDRLYGLGLEEFTGARNDLARRLREGGDRENAERVKALTKPPVSAWAVNQLARSNELEVQRLVKVSERLREAQADAAREPDAFREATLEEREVVNRLRDGAQAILTSAGHAASDSTLDRIATTLRAAAVTDEGRKLLKRGRFEEDREATGFEAFTGLRVAPKPADRPARKPASGTGRGDAARERRLESARAKVEKARADARDLGQQAEAAEREAAEARGTLERAERNAGQLRARAERAAERLERAEGELEALTRG